MGLAGSASAYFATKNVWTELAGEIEIFGNVAKALGPDRSNFTPEFILESFLSARTGQLMSYYQTFWPIDLNVHGLAELKELCSVTLESHPAKWHRVAALPAVANIHAFGRLDNLGRQAAHVEFATANFMALNTQPSREVLEILWQNAHAALIRSESSWHEFELNEQLIEIAETICQRFLMGDEVLFAPAVLAFHALLSYSTALRLRENKTLLPRLDKAIAGVLAHKSNTSSIWFQYLANLMAGRREFSMMLPQLTEVLIGHKAFPRDVADYAILFRLKLAELNMRAMNKGVESSYLTPERAEQTTKNSLTLIGDYGVEAKHWLRLRKNAEAFLGRAAIKYFDHVFGNYDGTVRTLVLERGEQLGARKLAALVPFRSSDEQTIAAAAYPGADDEDLARFILGSGLVRASKRASDYQLGRFERIFNRRLRDERSSDRIEEELTNALQGPLRAVEEHKDYLKSIFQSSLGGPVRPFQEDVVGGSPALREIQMDEEANSSEEDDDEEMTVAEIQARRKMLVRHFDLDNSVVLESLIPNRPK